MPGVARNEAEQSITVTTTMAERVSTMALVDLVQYFNVPIDWLFRIVVHSIDNPNNIVTDVSCRRTAEQTVADIKINEQ